jgi:hypothetical protein
MCEIFNIYHVNISKIEYFSNNLVLIGSLIVKITFYSARKPEINGRDLRFLFLIFHFGHR